MKILVINAGSSSIRFRIMDVSLHNKSQTQTVFQNTIQGAVHGIGNHSRIVISVENKELFRAERQIEDHEQAFIWMFESLQNKTCTKNKKVDLTTIEAVGHRVVHGGDRFSATTFINERVLQEIQNLNELAPLHNPACLTGIYQSRAFFDDSIPMVAVFDTMFHHTLPEYAKTYAIPFELTQRYHIKRYGFHGIAHTSLANSYAEHTGRGLNTERLLTLQLGNGCSITAIDNGKSIDTSMGLTPCEGLMMGTRSGDVDPTLVSYLSRKEQVPVMGAQSWLNDKSGLLGVSLRTSDMRSLIRIATTEGDSQAQLAIDMFCYRIRKYLGSYWAVLEGADAVIFGGGIGEHAPEIREQICKGMEWAGLKLDTHKNQSVQGMNPGQVQEISQDTSAVGVYVVGTDEEALIAEETVRCLQSSPERKEIQG